MTKFPAHVDDSSSLPPVDDSEILGINFNLLRDAVLAIESELGTTPSSVYSTVKARLDLLENNLNNLNILSLSNDLSGTLSNPQVVGIQGRPIVDKTPSFNDIITWNGIAWDYAKPVDTISVTGAVQGTIIYYDGYNWKSLPPSTPGFFLRTNGPNLNPSWEFVSGGGGGGDGYFTDQEFLLSNAIDSTKKLNFNLSNITTSTTRTITVPDGNITLDDSSATRVPTDLSVTTGKIANFSVSFAKIQNVTGPILLGRTSGAGSIQTISLGGGFTFNGNFLVRQAITGEVTVPFDSTVSTIANGVVTNNKIANSTITYSKLNKYEKLEFALGRIPDFLMDAASLSSLSNGDTVNTWVDYYNPNNTFVKTTGTVTYNTSGFNSLPAVRFQSGLMDGYISNLTGNTATMSTRSPLTFIMVIQGTLLNQFIYQHTNGTQTNNIAFDSNGRPAFAINGNTPLSTSIAVSNNTPTIIVWRQPVEIGNFKPTVDIFTTTTRQTQTTEGNAATYGVYDRMVFGGLSGGNFATNLNVRFMVMLHEWVPDNGILRAVDIIISDFNCPLT